MDSNKIIFARNCEVCRIDKQTSAGFLSVNHRLGDASCRYRYALKVKRSTSPREDKLPAGQIVAVSEFSSARRWMTPDGPHTSYEWVRYACLKGYTVVGGMSMMLSRFVKEVDPDDVMSYADPDSEKGGQVYYKLGFEYESRIEKPGFTSLKFRKTFRR